MEMARFVEGLESDLAAVAAVGDEQTRAAAERVLQAIRGSAGLRLLDVLGEAAMELNAPPARDPQGHDRAGRDPRGRLCEQLARAHAFEGCKRAGPAIRQEAPGLR